MLDWLTHERIVLIYAISGVLMAIGVYFTIRYRPYCTLKSPEKEKAMELHRKQILEEPMSEEEVEQVNKYISMSNKYVFGDVILLYSIMLHIFFGLGFFNLSPLYFLSVVLMAFKIASVKSSGWEPFCFLVKTFFSGEGYKRRYLKYINVYLKKINGEILSDDENIIYKDERNNVIFFIFFRYTVNTGVLLHLTLDIWFALNGVLVLR